MIAHICQTAIIRINADFCLLLWKGFPYICDKFGIWSFVWIPATILHAIFEYFLLFFIVEGRETNSMEWVNFLRIRKNGYSAQVYGKDEKSFAFTYLLEMIPNTQLISCILSFISTKTAVSGAFSVTRKVAKLGDHYERFLVAHFSIIQFLFHKLSQPQIFT